MKIVPINLLKLLKPKRSRMAAMLEKQNEKQVEQEAEVVNGNAYTLVDMILPGGRRLDMLSSGHSLAKHIEHDRNARNTGKARWQPLKNEQQYNPNSVKLDPQLEFNAKRSGIVEGLSAPAVVERIDEVAEDEWIVEDTAADAPKGYVVETISDGLPQGKIFEDVIDETKLDDFIVDQLWDKGLDTVVSEPTAPSTEEASIAEPVESKLEEALVAEPVESKLEEARIAEPVESKLEEALVAEPVESKLEEAIVAEPVESKLEEAIVAEPVESKLEEAIIAEPVEAKLEEAVVAEPVESKLEEEAIIAEPVENKLEEAIVAEPVESKLEEAIIAQPVENKLDKAIIAGLVDVIDEAKSNDCQIWDVYVGRAIDDSKLPSEETSSIAKPVESKLDEAVIVEPVDYEVIDEAKVDDCDIWDVYVGRVIDDSKLPSNEESTSAEPVESKLDEAVITEPVDVIDENQIWDVYVGRIIDESMLPTIEEVKEAIIEEAAESKPEEPIIEQPAAKDDRDEFVIQLSIGETLAALMSQNLNEKPGS